MGRIFRLIFVLGAVFVFGILTERDMSARRCADAGGVALEGVCIPGPEWGKANE